MFGNPIALLNSELKTAVERHQLRNNHTWRLSGTEFDCDSPCLMMFSDNDFPNAVERVRFTIHSRIKKGSATYIAPLQPPTLASFQTWGSSAGAGRIRLTRGKSRNNLFWCNNRFEQANSKFSSTANCRATL